MSKTYHYLLPVLYFIISWCLSLSYSESIEEYLHNNVFGLLFFVIILGIPLIWLNILSRKFKNTILKYLTITLIALVCIWLILMVMLSNSF